jgi:hypothetical protein
MSFPGMQTRPGATGQGEYAGLDEQQQKMVKMVNNFSLPPESIFIDSVI